MLLLIKSLTISMLCIFLFVITGCKTINNNENEKIILDYVEDYFQVLIVIRLENINGREIWKEIVYSNYRMENGNLQLSPNKTFRKTSTSPRDVDLIVGITKPVIENKNLTILGEITLVGKCSRYDYFASRKNNNIFNTLVSVFFTESDLQKVQKNKENMVMLPNNNYVFSEIKCYNDEYTIIVDCYLAVENGKQNPRTRLLIDDL